MTRLASIDQAPDPSDLAGHIPCDAEDDVTRHLLRPHFGADRETLIFAGFDAFERLVRLERVGGDHAGRCIIPPRCWQGLIGGGVATVIMAHNHPSGIARPSDADVSTTRETALFLRTLGIELVDHLIFVADGHFSFRSAGML
ncbi:JAB domain-containing protein [Sphingopyxis sp.]|uniref:JAB domain-containing protein n=1 Tax=Sphingopyxis sp. TaxID=1908224 RepID=UPI003D09B80D